MAKLLLKEDVNLTEEEMYDHFKEIFYGKYSIEHYKHKSVDVVINKSAWTAIAVKLVKKTDKTYFRLTAYSPSLFVRLTFYGVIPAFVLLFYAWPKCIKDVKQILSESDEFKDLILIRNL
jgi:hypothetical protein